GVIPPTGENPMPPPQDLEAASHRGHLLGRRLGGRYEWRVGPNGPPPSTMPATSHDRPTSVEARACEVRGSPQRSEPFSMDIGNPDGYALRSLFGGKSMPMRRLIMFLLFALVWSASAHAFQVQPGIGFVAIS